MDEQKELRIRVDHDAGPMEVVEAILSLAAFFGGKVEDFSEKGDTHVDYVIKK